MSKGCPREKDFYNVLSEIITKKDGFHLQKQWLESIFRHFPAAIKESIAKQDVENKKYKSKYIYFTNGLSFKEKHLPERIKRNPKTGEKIIKKLAQL